MSRKRNDRLHRLAQRNPDKDRITAYASNLFPTVGKRTQRKIASLVDLFINGRKRI